MTSSELKTKFTDLDQALCAIRTGAESARVILEEIETEMDRLSSNARAGERHLIKQELEEVTRLINNVVREL